VAGLSTAADVTLVFAVSQAAAILETEIAADGPRLVLRAEGAALALAAAGIFAVGGHGWLTFAALFLVASKARYQRQRSRSSPTPR
jgi:hypothetical protein